MTMTNKTIYNAERALYLDLLERVHYHPIVNEWLAALPEWLAAIKDKQRYAHAPAYLAAVEKLPQIDVHSVDLDTDTITIQADLSEAEYKQITALMKQLMPWRKGPFQIGSGVEDDRHTVFIDTEWHSDWKWQRIAPHLVADHGTLEGRYVLDVGGGSGYHGWRMAGAGAKQVIIIDPSCLFYHQFMAIRHFVGAADHNRTHYIPVGLEALPRQSQLFDVVFCMGVLYHRPSPFEHLQQLKGQLVKGGQLVLETLVVEGDDTTVLVPHNRYAKMNNVYFLPSVAALTGWLNKVGFTEVRCVDIDITSVEEQRATEWMTYQSLSDFLDPSDSSKTIEGYPAPMRATLIATK